MGRLTVRRQPAFFCFYAREDAVPGRGLFLMVYENEGHGFSKVENQIDAYKRVADFLKAHVPPADCSCSLNE